MAVLSRNMIQCYPICVSSPRNCIISMAFLHEETINKIDEEIRLHGVKDNARFYSLH